MKNPYLAVFMPDYVPVDVKSRPDGRVSVNIIDATGGVVKAFEAIAQPPGMLTRIKLDTRGLLNGSYLIVVRDKEGMKLHPLTVRN